MPIPNRFVRTAASALVAVTIFLASLSAAPAADQQTPAGAWVTWADIQPGVRVPMLQTLTVDGLIISSDILMFGGMPGVPIRTTPLHGIWERVGANDFATTNLVLIFDSNSSLLIGFARARARVSYVGKGADQLSGTVQVQFLACPSPFACPDPQAADAAWVPFPGMPATLQVTSTRVRLVE